MGQVFLRVDAGRELRECMPPKGWSTVTSTHIPLAKAIHVAKPSINGVGKIICLIVGRE